MPPAPNVRGLSLVLTDPIPKNVRRIDDVVDTFANLTVAVSVYLIHGILVAIANEIIP